MTFSNEARDKVLRGATALADAVRITLGPSSKCVLIGKGLEPPLVCDDGVTIARELFLLDAAEDLGARMLKQAALRTSATVGDGTTTATLLAHAMYAEGVKNVIAGASAVDLKRGLDRGLAHALITLRELSRPVGSSAERVQVATISAHGNAAIGRLVAEAVQRVGHQGVITVEPAATAETTLEMVDGVQFGRGYASPCFVTDTEQLECVLDKPLILLCDAKITSIKDLFPLLEAVCTSGRSLLILAEEIDGAALATLVLNKLRGTMAVCAVRAPEYGERRRAVLEDIAILTGAKVIAEDLGSKLSSTTLADLGSVARASITHDQTTLIDGNGQADAIRARVEQLRRELARTVSEHDRKKLQSRLAHLAGGVAIIHVWAATEIELKNRLEAFDDAIHTTQAAIAEGVVPGGGLALLRCIDALADVEAAVEGDERTGVRILRRALEVPTRQIAVNAGVDPGVVLNRMRTGTAAWGFDAALGRFCDLYEAGIIDATRVVRTALENAVSVAGVLLLTEATMTDVSGGVYRHAAEPPPPDL
ncbi:60 kDa chaperonin 5 [Deltaproteobacteria bacterium]|nr:60 kDa chaperonin 5 [Deltaproteobacteria bacterium]